MLLVLLLLSGCQNKPEETKKETGYRVYYVNKNATKVVGEPFQPEGETKEELFQELLSALMTESENPDYRRAIPAEVKITDAYINGDQAYLMFDNTYSTISRIPEILGRAAVVRTLTQLEGVEYVSFYVNEQPLMDESSQPVGRMRASDFMDDLGGDINDYQKVTLNLYFANEAGDQLKEMVWEGFYGTNVPMERKIVELLIAGPDREGYYPVLPKETKLLTISTRDGVCYVNLDASFLTGSVNTNEVVPIYAIVNSLVELPSVNKVQLLINGETNKKYRELVSLNTILERNLDIIEETTEEMTETEGTP